MTKRFQLTLLLLLIVSNLTFAQNIDSLRSEIQKIISTKNAIVGVSIVNGNDTLSINGDKHLPLQSVFKFHVAIVILSQIDEGKLSIDQKIKIRKKDLLPDLYSPIKKKYPNGTTMTISEILEYTVSQSDNIGCDILLKLVGGPKEVEKYFIDNNFTDLSIKINEEIQQSNWDLQFQNWTTPKAANDVLMRFYYNKTKLLSKKSYDFIWKIMMQTKTGKDRLRGLIPSNVIVAHKTGSSGVNKEGTTAAVNDIGVIFLPNGKPFFISIFVTDSKETLEVNERIIAEITKSVWKYFLSNKG